MKTQKPNDMLKKVQNWHEFNAIISDVMKTHKAYECSDCSFSGLGIISGNRESHCLEHAKDGKCRMYSRHKNKIDNLILKKQKED